MDNANASTPHRTTAILALLWLTARSVSAIQPHSNDYATQGFYFDWNAPSTVLPTPITAQCETLNVHWNRAAGTGPDPIPPFFLRVYSSAAANNTGDSFQLVPAGNTASTQLTIPFPPGTLYVICMTDSVGVSGGCQDLYTVYPNATNQACSGFTPPAQVLGMNAISLATQSPFSRWSWPVSCTDLHLEPIDDGKGGIKGTPPYTLTVAPSIRPPLNITFEQSVKWTITLGHGTPFFLSVSDANGVTWTDGPLHAGAGDKSCLSQSTDSQSGLSAPTTIGTAVGSFFLGGILAVIVFWLVVRRHRNRNQRPSYQFDGSQPSTLGDISPRGEISRSTLTPLTGNGDAEAAHAHPYTVLANSADSRTRKRPINFGPLDSPKSARQRTPDGHSSPPESSIPLRTTFRNSSSSHLSASSPTSVNPPPLPSSIHTVSNPPVPGAQPIHEVFVVHHDAGAPPPVTVYALPGSRVTELPPGYNFGSRPPSNAGGHSPSQPQLALVGEHPPPGSPPSLYSRRDQKASYTPRPSLAPTTSFPPPSFPPPDLISPTSSTADERARAVTPTRVLPSTPQMQPSSPIRQTPPMPDLPTSITSRTRGPRAMSPPDEMDKELWK